MAAYIALVRKDDNSTFGVEFPDFPGCISGGDSLSEVVASAREALALHVRGMVEDGETVPAPSSLEDVSASEDAVGAVPVLVELPPARGRTVRVNVTFEEWTLRAIDTAAAAVGLTRSAFLAEAARRAMRAA